jgi:3D (Asp-Asp-Asp) domain-containing protein
MNLASIALTGFFVWSSVASSSVLTSETPSEILPEPVPALAAAPAKTIPVRVTGYNAVPEQTDSDPFTTASGAYSNPEVVAAVSRDLRGALPYGTVVKLSAPEGATGKYCGWDLVEHFVGYRVIADTMNARHVERVDILFAEDAMVDVRVNGGVKNVNAARALASCGGIEVEVVGKLDIKDIPKTQAELGMRVEQTFATN